MNKYKSLIVPTEINQLILMFYLLDIEPNMIFDKESINKAGLCEIVNDHKIKMIKGPCGYSETWIHSDYGSSARLKYGISINPNDNKDIKSIGWKVKITVTKCFPNTYYFIGVTSNRAKDFKTSPYLSNYEELPDAYGISGCGTLIFDANKQRSIGGCADDGDYIAYQRNTWISVKYVIDGRKLIFNYVDGAGDNVSYEMVLQTKSDKITHFYPCVGLRDAGDECEVIDIVVE